MLLFYYFKLCNYDKFSPDNVESGGYITCTRNADVKLHINHCSTNIKKYSFSFRSAKQWNRLSPWTRRAEDLSQFKNMLDVDKKREILEFDID
jgi:hypothetical protein